MAPLLGTRVLHIVSCMGNSADVECDVCIGYMPYTVKLLLNHTLKLLTIVKLNAITIIDYG